MRIAQVAPLFVRIPPARYGGIERVIHALGEELTARGHEVVLFGPGDSQWPGEVVAACPRPLWELQLERPLAYHALHVEQVVQRSAEFDVIHSHVEYLHALGARSLQAPVVTTVHDRLDLPELRSLFEVHPEQALVSITDAQRTPLSDLPINWAATVHHGFRAQETSSLGRGDGGYVAFLGRMSAQKGPAAAIRVAVRAGIPIKLAARLNAAEQDYFTSEVEPLLGHSLVEWIGEVDDGGRRELLAGASALLLPIDWDEPFGLVLIEALAAGTPVISRPRGSLPEIVRHGEHGFLVQTEDEMVDACLHVRELNRAQCRSWVLERFSVERMASAYEGVYQKLRSPAAAAGAGREEKAAAVSPRS